MDFGEVAAPFFPELVAYHGYPGRHEEQAEKEIEPAHTFQMRELPVEIRPQPQERQDQKNHRDSKSLLVHNSVF